MRVPMLMRLVAPQSCLLANLTASPRDGISTPAQLDSEKGKGEINGWMSQNSPNRSLSFANCLYGTVFK